jgi:methionine--tRNA ligase beta chain
MDNITLQDFEKINLKVATVKAVKLHPSNKDMYILLLDLGPEAQDVQVVAGLKKWYNEDEFIGKRVVYVANLEPKIIGRIESQGMILAADDGENKPLLITTIEGELKPNSKVR